ncbi:MAG: calcium-translocating P-type ATPase, PMCA-type [Deltaproteobacteria bacterium]|nr:calcium-translocating P-type ATPase, PMCA-type [Deltaproteobacteria bacterium]
MQSFDQTIQAARALGVDPERGLTAEQAAESLAKHGDNRMPEPETASIWELFLEALKDKTLLILMGAAVLALGVEILRARLQDGYSPHYIDGLAILSAVAIASLVATLNQVRAQKEFSSLRKVRENIGMKVLRAGQVKELSIFDLVVGDIVYLSTGDRVPADGQLLRGVDLTVDESTLTGESVPVEKSASDLEMKSGSTITGGSGVMLVSAVGRSTELGKLQASLTEGEEDPTPLQERLSGLADRIGVFGLGAAILTFLALAISGVVRGQIGLGLELATLSALLEFAIIAVTIVVVAVPEGLPLAVTISLAYSIQKMAKDNSLVRKLVSCETMGAATVICSDKTGTLTKNQMAVARAYTGGSVLQNPSDATAWSAADRTLLQDIAAINSTAFIEHDGGTARYLGNPTEGALLSLLEAWGIDWRTTRNRAQVLHQFSFSSERKRMSTLVRDSAHGLELLVKGAPEVILSLCRSVHAPTGPRPLGADERRAILEQMERFSAEGQRTLGLAYRVLAEGAPGVQEHGDAAAKLLEDDLIFFGLIAISDPVRPEVNGAIAAARSAGVEVKMVTGDNRVIAEAISRELSLLGPEDVVLEGAEFREKSDLEITALLPRLRVLARSSPSDKHRLVRLLKSSGAVVAVTGDGTNDAPALKDADVGFAMGRSGTEVAKEASDIVIVDDNFASIVRAIQWGRSVFENIRKFLQFQLTVNVVALSTAFLAAVMGLGTPLNTVQLLWVNLLMDSLAALALAAEPPRPVLLQQLPHGRHAPLISKPMWASIAVMSAVMVTVLVLILETGLFLPADTAPAVRNTFVFNTFVMMQLFNEVNARATRFSRSVLDGLFKSRLFIAVVVSTALVQVLIVQAGGSFFRTVPLSLDLWIASVILGASVLVIGFVVRKVGSTFAPGWDSDAPSPAPEGALTRAVA